MNERHSVRYGSELFPKRMRRVLLSWEGSSLVETQVVDYCSLGIRVSIPPMSVSSEIPKKNDTVRVVMPIDCFWISGMCVYATNELDGSVTMGIYFYNPREQNLLHKLLNISLDERPQKFSFIKHEWEELVFSMCNSEDPKLQKIGIAEMERLKVQQ